MLDSYANGASAPVPFDIPKPHLSASSIAAQANDQAVLLLKVPADALLSQCWAKACAFAQSFGAAQISVELLLLGATHVHDAEAVLSEAAPNVEVLNHVLATRCAKRSFSAGNEHPITYQADKILRGLLARSAALASIHEVPRLTLSLLLDAIAEQQPPLPIIEVLPSLKTIDTPNGTTRLLAELADRVRKIEYSLKTPNTEDDTLPLFREQPNSQAQTLERLAADITLLKHLLLYYPDGTTDMYEAPHLAIPTHTDFIEAISSLPERLTPLVINAVFDEISRRESRELTVTERKPKSIWKRWLTRHKKP